MSRRLGSAIAFGLLAAAAASMPAWAEGITERVNLGPGGIQGNGDSRFPAISAGGRFVAFESEASNLVPGDTNSSRRRVRPRPPDGHDPASQLGQGGVEGNYSSYGQAISSDGRFVAFDSSATNLVPGDTNGAADVFVRDRQTGTTRRVSLGPGGVQGNACSHDPAISADGRFVAFASDATNLVPGDTNGSIDVFVRDRQTGTTRRVSLGPGGVQGDGVSYRPGDLGGRAVRRLRLDRHQPGAGRHQRCDGRVRPRSRDRHDPPGEPGAGRRPGQWEPLWSLFPAISADGRFVAFVLGCHQPGAGRHQRLVRRVRPRPPDRYDPPCEPGTGRRPGQWWQL